MNIGFFVLLWISVPSGGHSEFFGAQADCASARARVVEASDTMYASECIPAYLEFLRPVVGPRDGEWKAPSEVYGDPGT